MRKKGTAIRIIFYQSSEKCTKKRKVKSDLLLFFRTFFILSPWNILFFVFSFYFWRLLIIRYCRFLYFFHFFLLIHLSKIQFSSFFSLCFFCLKKTNFFGLYHSLTHSFFLFLLFYLSLVKCKKTLLFYLNISIKK